MPSIAGTGMRTMVIEVRPATLEDLPGLVPIQRETKDFHLAADPTFFARVRR